MNFKNICLLILNRHVLFSKSNKDILQTKIKIFITYLAVYIMDSWNAKTFNRGSRRNKFIMYLYVFSNLKYIYPIALTIFIIPSVLCNLNLKTHNEQKISRWTNVSITPFLTVNVVFKFYRQSNYHFTQNYNFAARK